MGWKEINPPGGKVCLFSDISGKINHHPQDQRSPAPHPTPLAARPFLSAVFFLEEKTIDLHGMS